MLIMESSTAGKANNYVLDFTSRPQLRAVTQTENAMAPVAASVDVGHRGEFGNFMGRLQSASNKPRYSIHNSSLKPKRVSAERDGFTPFSH